MGLRSYFRIIVQFVSSRLRPLWTGGFWLMMENPNYFKPKPQVMKYIRSDAGPYLLAMGITLILVACIISINYLLRKRRKAKSGDEQNPE